MLKLRPSHLIDRAERSWLKARHHFRVTPDGNPAHGALGPLIVWNDDEIAPGSGFGLHHHADMEIITFVRQGAVTHQDSVGNVGVTQAGDVQVMSAGTGIRHSERNEGYEPLRIFQIWIEPRSKGNPPRWGSRTFPRGDRAGRLVPLASGVHGDEDALLIDADARVLGATLLAGQRVAYAIRRDRYAYLTPSNGSLIVNGQRVDTGDGLAVIGEEALDIVAVGASEMLLVEVAHPQ